jgi:hypothetical protein
MRFNKTILVYLIIFCLLSLSSRADTGEGISGSGSLSAVCGLLNISCYRAPDPKIDLPLTILQSPFNAAHGLFLRVCADGSKESVFRLDLMQSGSINLNLITLRMKQDPLGSLPDEYGKFNAADKVLFGSNRLEWRYTHPSLISQPVTPGNYKDETAEVVYNGHVISELKIRFMTTPVIMVHGLWGDPSTWKSLEARLNTGYLSSDEPELLKLLCFKTNYNVELQASASLLVNSKYLRDDIKNMIYHLDSAGVSCGKVDLVAHSMGGLVSRYCMMEYRYDKYVRKLITSNTPHSGSQAANFLLSGMDGASVAEGAIKMTDMGSVNDGAIYDLQTGLNENGTGILRQPANLDKQRVPSHAIYTKREIIFPEDYSLWNQQFKRMDEIMLINLIAGHRFTNTQKISLALATGSVVYLPLFLEFLSVSVADLASEMYNTESNDVIVPFSSQKGGLADNHVSFIEPQKHIGAVENLEVMELIETLLRENPGNSTLFSNGFDPPEINFTMTSKKAVAKTLVTDSVWIVQPQDGSTYNPGDTIFLQVAGTEGVMNIMSLAGNENIAYNYQEVFGDSASFNIIVPEQCPGGFWISAVAEDSLNQVLQDSVWVNVNYSLQLDSLFHVPDEVSVSGCQSVAFQLKGLYNDSLTVNLTHDPLLELHVLDSNVAVLSGPGKIRGINPGFTNVRAVYQEDTVYFQIRVWPENNVLIGDSTFCEGSQGCELTVDNPLNGRYYTMLRNGTPVSGPLGSINDQLSFGYQNTPGVYTLSSYDSILNCENHHSNVINLIQFSRPFVYLGTDTTIISGDSVVLNAMGVNCTYLWSDGTTQQTLTIDTTGQYWVMVTNGEGCAGSDTVNIGIIVPGGSISGVVKYNNAQGTALDGTILHLIQNGEIKYQVVAAIDGSFEIPQPVVGEYSLEITCNHSWGGVNAVDALLIMKHFVGAETLTGLSLKCTDVDASGFINSIDALLTMKRFVGMTSSFAAGNWKYEPTTFIVGPDNQNNVELNIQCVGDVNRSYSP